MLVQNIGRIFRADFPTVMHFVDNDSIFKDHWYRSRKWYIKRNGSITEHNITEHNIIDILPISIQNKNFPPNQLSLEIIDNKNLSSNHLSLEIVDNKILPIPKNLSTNQLYLEIIDNKLENIIK